MSAESWDVLLVVIGAVTALYLYGKWENSRFGSRGVKSLPTGFPFVGHMMKILTGKEHFLGFTQRMYNSYPAEKYVGVRQFLRPLIMVTDLELLKQITVKDFDHFSDHLGLANEKIDPLFANNLFSLKGQKWRDMRSTLSPAFTSAKMRGMFDFVARCGEQMADYYLEQAGRPENKAKGLVEVEMKDAFTRYTNDVIATSAFGLEVNSLKDYDNHFYKMGKQATDFSGVQMLKFLVMFVSPKILSFLRIPFMTEEVQNFFRNLVQGTMKQREEQNIVRPDMIQLLMEAKKGSLKHEDTIKEDTKEAGFATVEESTIGKTTVKRKWTDDELTAQAFLFLLAGFDTASTLLCFMGHELALHPSIQKRLQEEIDEVAASNSNSISYNDLQSMQYLDMVVSESLRLWPPAVSIDRKCVKTYTLPPSNENASTGYTLKPEDGLIIPIVGIHRDPRYFQNPDTFDPERFSDENKNDIVPFSFIPFGAGPRNCIGSRFALMEAKAVIFHLLRKFDFVKIPKTKHPMELKMNTFNMMAKNGFWIGLKPRNKSN